MPMNPSRRTILLSSLAAAMLPLASHRAEAAAEVRLGVLKFGTVSWELDTIAFHKLDEAQGLKLVVTPFAGEDATNVALQAGAVDMIVSDWLWVSRQRSEGGDLTQASYSTAVGALMVKPDSPIKTLADVKGKKIGVAGGPLDKSWLLLRALAQRDDKLDLAKENEVVFGAPPLLAEKVKSDELDATLNFWHFCARLEAEGFRRIISAQEASMALGASGPVSALGYVFHEAWAKQNPGLVAGFLKASHAAKQILAKSEEEWARLQPLIKAEGKTLETLRDRYREGIPTRPTQDEEADAAKLYAVLAAIGGEKLVGKGATMAPGTFWPEPVG